MKSHCRAIALITALSPMFALAHHGTRFLIAVEYDMVRQPFFFFNGTYSQFRHEENATLLEPAILLPVGKKGLSEFEIHAHIEREGSERFRHEGTGFEFRHRFTKKPGWNFAAGLEYETTQPDTEEPNNWTGTLIAGKEDEHGMLLFNLVDTLAAEDGTRSSWGYRAAWSPTPNGLTSYSIEFQGDFEKHGSHEIAFGVMHHLDLETMLKVGVGTGLTPDSPKFTLRIGIAKSLGGIE